MKKYLKLFFASIVLLTICIGATIFLFNKSSLELKYIISIIIAFWLLTTTINIYAIEFAYKDGLKEGHADGFNIGFISGRKNGYTSAKEYYKSNNIQKIRQLNRDDEKHKKIG